jgi:hypothetical protein
MSTQETVKFCPFTARRPVDSTVRTCTLSESDRVEPGPVLADDCEGRRTCLIG